MAEYWPDKDSNSVEPYFIVWCDPTGINTGAAADNGELQGETISTVTWTLPAGLTKDSSNQTAVTIRGVSYGANTVATIWLSGGTVNTTGSITCRITTSGIRTLDKTVLLRIVEA